MKNYSQHTICRTVAFTLALGLWASCSEDSPAGGYENSGLPEPVTEVEPQLPNGGFEVTSHCDSKKYVSFYDPEAVEPSLKNKFWDSGSCATTALGSNAALCYSSEDVPDSIGSCKSARLESKYVVVKFAAGNLFTGTYVETVGLRGGKVNFGRPFTGRPKAVRFWYKYLGGTINYAQSDAPAKLGDEDQCKVMVALGTWKGGKDGYGGSVNCPVQVNTTDKSTFWDYRNLPETIAYGEFVRSASEAATEWTQVTLPLDYTDFTSTPTHIIVSCASSRFGDYFTGSTSSRLYLDSFELLYE